MRITHGRKPGSSVTASTVTIIRTVVLASTRFGCNSTFGCAAESISSQLIGKELQRQLAKSGDFTHFG